MSVKKNYIYNSGYTIINMLLPLVTAPYLARVIGAKGVGVYAFSFAMAQFFVLIAKLGLTNYGTREIAASRGNRDKLSHTFSNLYTMQCIATLLVFILYLCYVLYFSGEYRNIAALFAIWVIGSFLDIDWFWFGMEEFKKITIRNILVKTLSVISIFCFVKKIDDVWRYALIMSAGYTAGYISIWFGIRKYISFVRPQKREVLIYIKPCLIMLIPVLALNIYRSMDKVMLGAMNSMTETGYYENGEKLVYCMSGLISSLGTVMLPRISELVYQKKQDMIEKYIGTSLRFIVAMTCAMAFGLMSVSDSLILILFGNEFEKSALILTLMAPKLIFMGWGNVIRTQYVIPYKIDDIYVKSVFAGSIINLLLNAALIPKLGAVGAVFATVAAEAFVPFYQFLRLKDKLDYKNHILKCLFYPFTGAVMLLILKFVQHVNGINGMTLIIQIGMGVFIFTILCYIYIRRYDGELWEKLRKF